MMITDNRKPKWVFYLGWVILSVVSIPIAWVIAWALISQVEKAVGGTIRVGGQTRITEDFLLSFVFFPLLGLLTGLLQYLLLRRYLRRMGWWIAATVVGWLLPFVVFRPLYAALGPALDVGSGWSAALMVVLIGGSIGLPQWLVLRQHVRHAAWWILASILGWGMVLLVTGKTLSSPLEMLAFGLLPSIAASIGLWFLLDRLPQREDREGNTPSGDVLEPTAKWFPWGYLIVTFGFSWLCWLPGVLETREVLDLPIPWEVFLLLGICGPLVGAIWVNVRKGGWTAARGLLARVRDVRIGAVWWLVILITPPVLSALALISFGLLQGDPLEPGVFARSWMVLPTILFMMLLGGGQEEFGWRGYALDVLQGRWGALVASLVLGVIWGVWHLPLFFVERTGQYYTPMWAFLLASPALSILTTWVYNGTGKRLFAAWLFHGVINAGMDVFPPVQKVADGDHGAFLILCGAYWVWALAVVVFGSRQLAGATVKDDEGNTL